MKTKHKRPTENGIISAETDVSILIKLPKGLVAEIDEHLAGRADRERAWGLRLPALRRWIEEGFARERHPDRAQRLADAGDRAERELTEAEALLEVLGARVGNARKALVRP